MREGKPYPPAGPEEVETLPGVLRRCVQLKDAGFVLIVVTNQPDVARGTTPRETSRGINANRLLKLAGGSMFIVCFHDNDDGCDCRKPRPGMLLTAAARIDIDLARSYMVGDRRRRRRGGHRGGLQNHLHRSWLLRAAARRTIRLQSFFDT